MRWRIASTLVLLPFVCTWVYGCDDLTMPTSSADELGAASFARGEPTAVPFVARWLATEHPPVPPAETPPGCVAYFMISATGQTTHLGRFTGTGWTCASNPRVVEEDPPHNAAGGQPPFLVLDFANVSTWTAANGDELNVATPNGVAVVSLTDGNTGGVGPIVINGGTGRFAGATGEGFGVAINEEVTFEGWIRYEASDRRH